MYKYRQLASIVNRIFTYWLNVNRYLINFVWYEQCLIISWEIAPNFEGYDVSNIQSWGLWR